MRVAVSIPFRWIKHAFLKAIRFLGSGENEPAPVGRVRPDAARKELSLMSNENEASKWNSRKFAALMVTIATNLLLWFNVESDLAHAFSSAAVNAVSLGYIIVQGWVDSRAR